ncbi:hypothetical protein P691DRAFT_343033 [Macrolepiota fuliginosa MF-IS2]|uniref:Uncharacterized protein n=1 Tax=Macrolepiota fuliginosa MF-IS2 TaxID=1400762 RepID=A0A9P5X793_9AGAR|nr:hypothetical protein P691DRAFT_343033 [Macrolepiota fuliginosa MF-IS2]
MQCVNPRCCHPGMVDSWLLYVDISGALPSHPPLRYFCLSASTYMSGCVLIGRTPEGISVNSCRLLLLGCPHRIYRHLDLMTRHSPFLLAHRATWKHILSIRTQVSKFLAEFQIKFQDARNCWPLVAWFLARRSSHSTYALSLTRWQRVISSLPSSRPVIFNHGGFVPSS